MYTRGIEARSAGVGMTRRCIVVHSGSGIGDRSVFAEEAALFIFLLFFQAEDGIRDIGVTGVQTCALPICSPCSTRKSRPTTVRVSPRSSPPFVKTNGDLMRRYTLDLRQGGPLTVADLAQLPEDRKSVV